MKNKLLSLALLGGLLAIPLPAQQAGGELDEEDQPGRGVARISLINGDVSVKRGDTGDLTAAAINAPLMVQDSMFTGPNSRAELQFDYSNMVRLAANTEVRIAEIEQNRYMAQVARGLVTFRVLREHTAEVELSTPSISIKPLRPGTYRVEVREDGTTEVTVRSGEVEVYTPQGSERVAAGRTVIARGAASNPEFRDGAGLPEDDWDRWNDRRDREIQSSKSYQYMSTDISGGEDLDNYGSWVNVPQYGNVWTPRVAAGWAPYQLGRWSWIDWYGWSWVSYDPWGWAPYHYGRWFNQPGYGWCWWPGARQSRHFWRPALVGFFGWGSGGVGVGIGFGRVGWTPLAPFERFRPWYGSRYYGGYRNNRYIDNSVRIVNNVNITNVYRNARVRNGVSGMDGSDFVGGRGGNRIRSFGESDLRGASSVQGRLPMVPERQSLRLADRQVTQRGSAVGDSTRFVSRRQPAQVERASFDSQRRGMEQVAQRAFGGDTGGRLGRDGSVAAGNDTGSRGGDTGARGNGSARSADGAGWRTLGDSGRRSADGAATQGTEAGSRGNGSARSAESGGWRTLGNSGRAAPQQGASVQSGDTGSRANGSGRSADSGGWRTFGSAGRRSSTDTRGGAAVQGDSGSSRGNGGGRSSTEGGGWRTFGSADSGGRSGSNAARSGGSAAAAEARSSGRSSSGEGRRQYDSGSSRSDSGGDSWNSRSSSDRGGAGNVQVNPPIVRNRGGDSSGGSRRSERYQAPSSSSRGESGRSASPSFGGGGRSGGFGGGGRMSGGNSGGGGGGRSSGGGGGRSSGGGGGRSGGGGRGR